MNDDDKELVIEHVETLDDDFVYYVCKVEFVEVNDVELYDVNVSYNDAVVGAADVLGICIEILDLIEEFTYRSPVACATITFRRMS